MVVWESSADLAYPFDSDAPGSMKSMMRLLVSLTLLMMVASMAAADQSPAPFQNGDVVCFIGDSITHSRKYHGYISLYYLTRFPERQIRFVNCGISGDSAGGGVARLDWDILPNRPNVVTLMFGMNDVSRGLYGKANPDAKNLESREAALRNYEQNMTRLAAGLQEQLHPRFILITPSPYDDTAQIEIENLYGVNDALGRCGEIGRKLAEQIGAGVVDFHGPMTALNQQEQKANPRYTLIGPDRVHPLDVGQMVMAYLFLTAQQVPATVSTLALDGDAGTVMTAENCTVTEARSLDGKLSFDCLEKSLPFPIDPAAQEALRLVPVEAKLDQESLRVRFAADGKYRVSIDGTPVGEWNRDELAAGVNLALNTKTPQYQQAAKVMSVNEQRRTLEIRLRSLAQIQIMLRRAKVDEGKDEAINAYFADYLEKSKVNGVPNAYFRSQFDNYLKTRPVVSEIKSQIEDFVQQLWKINQPVTHHWEIEKVG